MRLIERLDRYQNDPEDDLEDGPEETADWGSDSDANEVPTEAALDDGVDATAPVEEPSSSQADIDTASPLGAEPDDGYDAEPSEDTPFPWLTALKSRSTADSTADTSAPRRNRRSAHSGGPRRIREGLRKGLTDERLWLQAQREELERERAEIEAEIEAEIADIETQMGHIDALLSVKAADSDEDANAWDPPSRNAPQVHRAG